MAILLSFKSPQQEIGGITPYLVDLGMLIAFAS